MLRTLPGCGFFMCLLGVGMILLNNAYASGKWVAAVAIFIYMAFFSVGMGATPWTVNSEIYPLHLRGIGNSMATFGNWASNYVISEVFLTATDSEIGQVISLHHCSYFKYNIRISLISYLELSALEPSHSFISFCRKPRIKALRKTSKTLYQT